MIDGYHKRPIDWDNLSYDEFMDILEDLRGVYKDN